MSALRALVNVSTAPSISMCSRRRRPHLLGSPRPEQRRAGNAWGEDSLEEGPGGCLSAGCAKKRL